MALGLKGGSQLIIQIVKDNEVTKDEFEAVKEVLNNRANNLGVAKFKTIGSNKLILEILGEQDPLVASRVIGKTALLEFRIQKENTSSEFQNLKFQRLKINQLISQFTGVNTNFINDDFVEIQNDLNYFSNNPELFDKLIDTRKYINDEIVNLFNKTELSGKDLVNAGRRQNQTDDNFEVLLSFSNESGNKFAEITKSIAGTDQLLSIILDGESISEANVGEQFSKFGITGGSVSLSGNFTAEEARELEIQLREGSLPLSIKIVEAKNLRPLFANEIITKSFYVAICGLIFVSIFMIVKLSKRMQNNVNTERRSSGN